MLAGATTGRNASRSGWSASAARRLAISRSTASARYLTGPVTTGCRASGLKKYESSM